MLDKRLWKEVKGNKAYYYHMALYALTSFLVSFFIAFFMANIVNHIFFLKDSFRNQINLFLGLVVVIIIRTSATFYFHRTFKRIAATVRKKLLLQTINEILEQGPVLCKEEAAGGRTTAITEASEHLEPYFSEYIPQFFHLVISLPLLLGISLYYDPITAFIMLVTGPVMPFFLMLIGIQSQKANQKRLASLTRLGSNMLDFLNGIRTLKIFGGTAGYRNRVADSSEEFRKVTMEVLRISFLSAFVLELAATISTAMIAVSLGIRLMYGKLEFYPAFFILLLTPEYYLAIRKYGAKFHTAMGAKAAFETLARYRNPLKSEKKEIAAGECIPCEGAISVQLRGITYQYNNSNVKAVQDINMDLHAGKVTAIVGKSGSGKSTLAFALMQFIEPEGAIYFNQTILRKVNPQEVRTRIAYIPQKPYIFHDTLRNNLLHSKPEASEEELLLALNKAALSQFLRQLPNGLDTIMTETGSNISVGEAQRLSFARAYLKDSPILLMDEGTSALDDESERLIRLTFEEISRDKTVIVIAHRLETVRNADLIYVLEEGRVIESGKHDILMSGNGRYKEMVSAW